MKNEKGTIVLAGGVIGLIAAILVFFGINEITGIGCEEMEASVY